MAKVSLTTLKNWFLTGLKPTQQQFHNVFDSYRHKDDAVDMGEVNGLNSALQEKADAAQFNSHANDTDAHGLNLIKAKFFEYLSLAEFVTSGKIRADKIEALAINETFKVSEISIASFAANNANYTFEKEDRIAIPDGQPIPKYQLFVFTGGDKTDVGNYIPTGKSTISIADIPELNSASRTVDKLTKTGANGQIIDGPFADDSGALVLPKKTTAAIPNTLRNDGDGLVYKDENGIDSQVIIGKIGLVSPAAHLNIGRNSGAQTANQIALGVNAGNGNTQSLQVAIGTSAGQLNIGTFQTAIGDGAGNLNEGNNSVGTGRDATSRNKGNEVVGFGNHAAQRNEGNSVVAVGHLSCQDNLGDNVIALGEDSAKNQGGNNIIALGKDAGEANGKSNAFIIQNDFLPSYADRAAAVAALTIGNLCVANNTYLYFNQATFAIEGVRL